MKKLMSLAVFFILFFSLLSIPILGTTLDNDNKIIAIIDGKEITENDINEDGLIKESVLNTSQESVEFKITPRNNSVPPVLYVKKGRNAMMVKKLTAPRFGQQTDLYFLNPESAKEFANKLTSSSSLSKISEGIIAITLGYKTHPHVGALYTAALMLKGVYLDSVKEAILKLTKEGKSVEVRMVRSTMNNRTLYYVGAWNGTTIRTKLTNTSNAREKVTFYKTN